MPDWSYQTLFRPLLFRLPVRAARKLTLGLFAAVGRMPGGAFVIKTLGHQEPSPLLETGWSATPVGLSGIVDPAGTARRGLARLGFGFMEIGPVTALPVDSREPIGLDADGERLLFPEPYENEGFNRVLAKLANPGHALPQYVAVAPMPGLAAEQAEPLMILMMQELAFAGAAGFYVDALPTGWELDDSVRALCAVANWMERREAAERRPLFLRVAPDIEAERLVCLLQKIDRTKWKGVVIGGGVRGEKIAEGDESGVRGEEVAKNDKGRGNRDSAGEGRWRHGGGSVEGACGKEPALATLRIVREFGLPEWIVKVGSGVHEPRDAVDFMRAGADAVLLGSGFVFAGPGLPKRVNDAIQQERLQNVPETPPPSFWSNWGWTWLLGLAMIVGGLAAWFVAGTTVLLPYDEDYLEMTGERLSAFNSHLLHFMSHDRITLAGTMLSLGILYYRLARFGIGQGRHWARTTVTVSCAVGFPSFFLYLGYGYFDPLHAAAAILLLPMFLLSLRGNPDRPYRGTVSLTNDRQWKRAMWGQLCFVALGIALAIGGLTIAGVGVTGVFVPSDLAFLGMSSAKLDAFNPRLVPLIAHDRAGFGGALLADALALLVTALWGIQKGERWLWSTLLFGGAPAFIAALGVHFHIGYTDFVHLLPAWFAFALYLAGLYLLYPYLRSNEK